MSLAWPWALAALLLVAAVVAFDSWRQWRCSAVAKVLAVVVRSAVLTALVLALSGPSIEQQIGDPVHVFVLDRSASIDDERLAQAVERLRTLASSVPSGHRRALVLADARPTVAISPDQPWELSAPDRSATSLGTDLGSATTLALSLIDPSAGGRVVVISDGADTHRKLAPAAQAARALGVPVDGITVEPPSPSPGIVDLSLERDIVRAGETLDLRVGLQGGGSSAEARLELALDGEVIEDRQVALPTSGTERLRHPYPLPAGAAPGPRTLSARLMQGEEVIDERVAGLTVGPPPTALLLASRERELAGIGAVLLSQGFEVRNLGPDKAIPELLVEADLVVIGDVPAQVVAGGPSPLSAAFLTALRRWVSAGGGLITLGGDQTYELGGWGASPIARALPLDLSPEAEDVEPSITVVHIIDNSASMGDWTGQQRKMALANEATVASMRLLRPRDQIEVMAVNTEVNRVLPLQAATDPTRMAAMIRSIKPRGGGIYVYTSLIAAEQTLSRSTTPLKHIILYSDAQDAEEKVKGMEFGWGPGPNAYQIAQRLRGRGVTLSVIALGDPRDQDVPFLRQLAEIGGGRFHITREADELRALYIEETRQIVQSVVKDSPIRARLAEPHPSLSGVGVDSAPPFLGYVEVKARPTASVPLRGGGDQPILATWQYGLGQVASMSTDLGPRWGRRWLDWADYSRFVAQLARWALRPPIARGAAVEVYPHARGLAIEVQRLGADGLALTEGGLSARLLDADGQVQPLDMRPVEPGLWAAVADAIPHAAYELVIEADGSEVARQAVIAPPALERTLTKGPALGVLANESGGVLNPESVGAPSMGTGRMAPIGWIFALIALVLLPLDAWLRRPARRP